MNAGQSPSKKYKTLRPGVSLFSEKVGSRLEPAGLPRIEGLSISAHKSRLFIFGGERCGLCSNDLFVFDVLDLSAVSQLEQAGQQDNAKTLESLDGK